jgi:hypothetical protein
MIVSRETNLGVAMGSDSWTTLGGLWGKTAELIFRFVLGLRSLRLFELTAQTAMLPALRATVSWRCLLRCDARLKTKRNISSARCFRGAAAGRPWNARRRIIELFGAGVGPHPRLFHVKQNDPADPSIAARRPKETASFTETYTIWWGALGARDPLPARLKW